MGLLQQASLVITPNAVKAGKLYSIIPTNGAGDLDVVRATSATRVNSAGLIEIPVTNLLLQSEVFTNGWTLESSTISANTTIAPNGTLTADTLSEVFANDIHRTYRSAITTIVGQNYAFSFYVKKDTSRYVRLSIVPSGASINVWSAVQFDLDTKTFTSGVGSAGGTFLNASILELADGWFRISMTGTATSTSTFFMLSLSNGSAILSSDSRGCVAYLGNTANKIIIWGAQLEEGITATEYIPTTTVVRTRFAGITQDGSSASNIARLDYTNGSCPSILVEPQRTNIALWSDMFNNAYWSKTNTTVSANTVISPSGQQDADQLFDNSTNGVHFIQINATGGAGTYTFSFFAKANSLSRIGVFTNSGVNVNLASTPQVFDLSNGNVVNSVSGITASTLALSNGWYRCQVIIPSSGVGSYVIALVSSGTTTSYVGTGSSLYLWGAQLEAGSNATSYIPTTTSSVTRNADVISKSGLSNLIGQTEGTFYSEIQFFEGGARFNGVELFGNSDNRIYIAKDTNDLFTVGFQANSIFTTVGSFNSSYNKVKIAIRYKSGNSVVYVNGVNVGSSSVTINFTTSINTLNCKVANNNIYILQGRLFSCAVFPLGLTNSELQKLTTL